MTQCDRDDKSTQTQRREGQPSFRAPKPGLSTKSEAEFHFTTEFIQEWKLQLKPKKILSRQKRLFVAVETTQRNAPRKNQEDKRWDVKNIVQHLSF